MNFVPYISVIGEGIDNKWSAALRSAALTIILLRAGTIPLAICWNHRETSGDARLEFILAKEKIVCMLIFLVYQKKITQLLCQKV